MSTRKPLDPNQPFATDPPGESDSRSQRARQREQTRERLFEAALGEFRRVGFAGAQIDRIAQNAGVVRGTFYFHFPKKEHVLLELRARAQTPVVEELDALDMGTAGIREALAAVARGTQISEELVADPGLMQEMVATYLRQSLDPAFDTQTGTLGDTLIRVFRGLSARGALRRGLDPEKAAVLVLTSLFGLFALAQKTPAEHRQDMEDLMDLLQNGLEPGVPS